MREVASGPNIGLPPSVLAELIAAVAVSGLPADLLKILRCLETDQQQLPAQAMQPLDEEGHSFLSAWLAQRYLRLRSRANRSPLAVETGAGNAQPLVQCAYHLAALHNRLLLPACFLAAN